MFSLSSKTNDSDKIHASTGLIERHLDEIRSLQCGHNEWSGLFTERRALGIWRIDTAFVC